MPATSTLLDGMAMLSTIARGAFWPLGAATRQQEFDLLPEPIVLPWFRSSVQWQSAIANNRMARVEMLARMLCECTLPE